MRHVEDRISPMMHVVLVIRTSLVILLPNTCLSVGSFHHCGTPAMYAISTIANVAVSAEEAPSESMVVSMSPVVPSLKSMPSFFEVRIVFKECFLENE